MCDPIIFESLVVTDVSTYPLSLITLSPTSAITAALQVQRLGCRSGMPLGQARVGVGRRGVEPRVSQTLDLQSGPAPIWQPATETTNGR